ncbi:unnamed protein product [Amoebophrya sp. A25]|nr:unnamed protein product [Amoebophrya sp. A25]|eukprot:GSA25T00026153001.1
MFSSSEILDIIMDNIFRLLAWFWLAITIRISVVSGRYPTKGCQHTSRRGLSWVQISMKIKYMIERGEVGKIRRGTLSLMSSARMPPRISLQDTNLKFTFLFLMC